MGVPFGRRSSCARKVAPLEPATPRTNSGLAAAATAALVALCVVLAPPAFALGPDPAPHSGSSVAPDPAGGPAVHSASGPAVPPASPVTRFVPVSSATTVRRALRTPHTSHPTARRGARHTRHQAAPRPTPPSPFFTSLSAGLTAVAAQSSASGGPSAELLVVAACALLALVALGGSLLGLTLRSLRT